MNYIPAYLMLTQLVEKDHVKRSLGVSNIVKDLCDMCPFQDNDDLIINDYKLTRYLLLSLPLMQKIVDNLINSLLFKFQGNLYFLHNFYRDIILIFKQTEVNPMEVYKQSMKANQRKREDTDGNESINGEEDFSHFVTKDSCFEIRVNILKIKQFSFHYFKKILRIFEMVYPSDSEL